ncbi:unnamed protein product [Adineta steineri]|uniref:Uncharacterized protein n=1 Tax=Adineta steineri TaxID=433720 RepID=A0A815T5X9_9BILA|nr:unnamed protein product [Adineta steineri]CAF3954218.1 unnamed protein product [Adineta steineri]
MAHNNTSILSDVSVCLSDAMDTMFNSNHSIMIPENNHNNVDISNGGGGLSAEALKLMMNKRKLNSNGHIIDDQQYEENAKRLCSMNGHNQHEQKA